MLVKHQFSNLAIIPARGGSKRIPRKNIKLFFNQPIIAYSIEVALNSGLFQEVMVSTDNEEIAEIAKQYGAVVPFMRSKKNADDFATTVDVLTEVLDTYKTLGKKFNYGCCIYPTAPFIQTKTLLKSYKKLISNQLDTVFPVLPFSFPIQRAVKISQKERIVMFQPEHLDSRSQDLEPAYHDSGQFYWFDTKILNAKRKLWTDNTGVIILSEMEAQDIDTLEDWKVAEFKYKLMLNAKK